MLRDLKEAHQTLQHDNNMITIDSDFNECNKILGLHYMLATELAVQDIWDQQDAPETHWRGSECIDHVYMYQEMMECVNTLEYLENPKMIQSQVILTISRPMYCSNINHTAKSKSPIEPYVNTNNEIYHTLHKRKRMELHYATD
jgi:hypothetical protein